MRMQGKVAHITGAAAGLPGDTMGFGGSSAWMMAKEGAKLVLTDIKEEVGIRTVAQMRERGFDAIFTKLDVTNETDWINAIDLTVTEFGKLDVLVNNAGTGSPYTVEETTEEEWDEQMDVHAKGTFLGTKHAIPEMRKSGGGSIINISSINGLVGSPSSTAYHAAKAAVRLFTKAAAVQYAKDNIRVNSVHPGYVLTPLTLQSFSNDDDRQIRVNRVPMNRLGTADEIGYGILYLASDESSFVTGSELVIDGGMTAQ